MSYPGQLLLTETRRPLPAVVRPGPGAGQGAAWSANARVPAAPDPRRRLTDDAIPPGR